MRKREVALLGVGAFVPFFVGVACGGGGSNDNPSDDGGTNANDASADAFADGDATPPPPTAGRTFFESKVQPLLASQCASCHLPKQFAFASLQKSGATFTAADTEANYQAFVDVINVDNPTKSRLLAKIIGETSADGMLHAGGKKADVGDATYSTLLQWIQIEKNDRCANCGVNAPNAFLAYVEQPRVFWAIERDPYRSDYGVRTRSRIKMQPVDPSTLAAKGAAFDSSTTRSAAPMVTATSATSPSATRAIAWCSSVDCRSTAPIGCAARDGTCASRRSAATEKRRTRGICCRRSDVTRGA